MADSNYSLGKFSESNRQLHELFDLIEKNRSLEFPELSIGVVEDVSEAYQLKVNLDLEAKKYESALMSSEKFKAKFLRDKIAKNPLNRKVTVNQKLKSDIYDLTIEILKNPQDQSLFRELSEIEHKAVNYEGDNYLKYPFQEAKKRYAG